ncbi:MAG: peptide-methionine (S)-S-oxide reductase MsrA [Xanthomonadales bacterium]|nr:peptide-methionine (S)-S-oxide reductase MsrA [Xanthomonadales bacterium]
MKVTGILQTLASLTLALTLGGCTAVSATNEAQLLPPPALDQTHTSSPREEVAVFAGGCFWGIEAVFERIRGVDQATAGYAGGSAATAHYAMVSQGNTGHAESVRVSFNPARVSYGTLLQVFFSVALDPTQRNRQGPDVGSQYRSVLFYTNDEQRRIASAYLAQLGAAKVFPRPIATQVQPLAAFYPAEPYHQGYYDQHPDALYIVINDKPKVARLQQLFPTLYRPERQFVQVQLQ